MASQDLLSESRTKAPLLTRLVSRIPFYSYIRLVFLLYLVLPQTQGARIIYEEKVHPFLEDNEGHIDDFISSAHDRLKAAGLAYIRQAIEYMRTQVLGMPPSEPSPAATEAVASQSYTQALLARFSVPAARWTGAAGAGNAGADFYNLLAGAVSAAAGSSAGRPGDDMTASGNLIPPNIHGTGDKMTFIAAQRERLNFVLSALDREAQQIQRDDALRTSQDRARPRTLSMSYDGAAAASAAEDDDEPTQRPPSGLSMWSALSKSRSEADFEKIEAESGAEDESAVRRRNVESAGSSGGGGSWMPWGWGSGNDQGTSSSAEK